MVLLSKIYTKGGDKGKTSLGTGKRVPKYDLRISAYGTVDEANATIGLVRQHTQNQPDLAEYDQMLSRIQNDLFDLGADLCVPEGEKVEYVPLRIIKEQVKRLENEIDVMNADLAPLKSFILPGGTPAAAALHLARTITRRAERLVVELAAAEKINPEAVKYLNRLSDHLFVLGRKLNDNGAADILWVPGGSR